MKTKKILLYCCAVLMLVACKDSSKQKEKKLEIDNSPSEVMMKKVSGDMPKLEDTGKIVIIDPSQANYYEKYKFGNTASTFRVNSDYLFLDIPVADVGLRIKSVKKITTNGFCALVVWLKSTNEDPNDNTETVKGLLQESYSIKELDIKPNKKKIAVFFWNNDTYSDFEERAIKRLEAAKSYKDIDFYFPKPKNGFLLPDEAGGDILGGG